MLIEFHMQGRLPSTIRFRSYRMKTPTNLLLDRLLMAAVMESFLSLTARRIRQHSSLGALELQKFGECQHWEIICFHETVHHVLLTLS